MLRNLRDSYKYYKKEAESPVPMEEYLGITQDFNKFVMQQVFEGEKVKLPEGMGTGFVKGKKIKPRIDPKTGDIMGAAPDWVGTKKLWEKSPEAKANKKLVYHLNEHTGGIRYKFFWSRKDNPIKNKSLYSLIFTRTNKRILHTLLKQGEEYIYIDY